MKTQGERYTSEAEKTRDWQPPVDGETGREYLLTLPHNRL